MGARVRYGLVGTGDRGVDMFARPLRTEFADVAELVGMYDANPLRAAAAAELAGGGVPVLGSFEALLAERPDVVLVATKDSTHDRYIVGALEAGVDVITEKPMTIDAARCRAILDARERSGRSVRVAFNYRWASIFAEAKRLLVEGAIGEVRSVDFHWYLDTEHGADYFRRWHRRMADSGGLFVHKATHHFDLVNWWLDDRPEAVTADGALLVYGANGPFRAERCSGCAHADACAFHVDVGSDPYFRSLYLEAESADGYLRDGCVFDGSIDIFDTMSATVRYRRGARMTYSLVAYAAYEGVRVALNGTAGRLEIEAIDGRGEADEIRLFPLGSRGEGRVVRVPRDGDGHDGADARLREALFRGATQDPLGRLADALDGAYSILVGVAANASVARGGWVGIGDLLGDAA
ncbi:MAG: Gfo/Idh/MocA family protein [Actinomycetota bacterium]